MEPAIGTIFAAIEDGFHQASMKVRMAELETRKAEPLTLLTASAPTVRDLLPSVAAHYRRKVERLAQTLNAAEDRAEAAAAIRTLFERITLTPGHKRGVIDATLRGDLATIPD